MIEFTFELILSDTIDETHYSLVPLPFPSESNMYQLTDENDEEIGQFDATQLSSLETLLPDIKSTYISLFLRISQFPPCEAELMETVKDVHATLLQWGNIVDAYDCMDLTAKDFWNSKRSVDEMSVYNY